MIDLSNVNAEPGGTAPSEIEQYLAAHSKALSEADKLAKICSTVRYTNRTLAGLKVEQ